MGNWVRKHGIGGLLESYTFKLKAILIVMAGYMED